MSQFAPTPLHGAAYAVAIEAVGGISAIGDCDTSEKFAALCAKLDAIREWAALEPENVRKAYRWAAEKVQTDARARLEVHENSRSVRDALATIPRPSLKGEQ
jgi:hypothetical protein